MVKFYRFKVYMIYMIYITGLHVICMSLGGVWHLCNLPFVYALFWLVSIASYVFKSPSICFQGTKYEINREAVVYLHSTLWRHIYEISHFSCYRLGVFALANLFKIIRKIMSITYDTYLERREIEK